MRLMTRLLSLSEMQHGKADNAKIRHSVRAVLDCREATQMAERTASGSLAGPSHSHGTPHTGAWQVLALFTSI